jgi:hypothetical protein
MKLTTKPHCKKHEAFAQECIGCRIKAKPTPEVKQWLKDNESWPEQKPQGLEVVERWLKDGEKSGSTAGSDLVGIDLDAEAKRFKSVQALKQFLKSVYNDGASGNRRSLGEDVQTIKELLN